MTTTADEVTERAARRRWITLGIVLIVQFMVILDATIVSVALPSIQNGLHFGSQLDLQWVVNAYALFFGGFLLLGGRAGDIFGHRRLFLAGVVVFTLASLFNGLAQSSGMLIGGRVAQGLGAAMVSPAVLSIILVAFTDHRERTKALGYFTAVSASGGGIGVTSSWNRSSKPVFAWTSSGVTPGMPCLRRIAPLSGSKSRTPSGETT